MTEIRRLKLMETNRKIGNNETNGGSSIAYSNMSSKRCKDVVPQHLPRYPYELSQHRGVDGCSTSNESPASKRLKSDLSMSSCGHEGGGKRKSEFSLAFDDSVSAMTPTSNGASLTSCNDKMQAMLLKNAPNGPPTSVSIPTSRALSTPSEGLKRSPKDKNLIKHSNNMFIPKSSVRSATASIFTPVLPRRHR